MHCEDIIYVADPPEEAMPDAETRRGVADLSPFPRNVGYGAWPRCKSDERGTVRATRLRCANALPSGARPVVGL